MDIRFIYITCKDTDQAREIGKALVLERLAACVNILPGMQSVYRWEGQIVEDQETVLIAKSTVDALEALKRRVCELHSYTCPCIVALPLSSGHEPYLAWIREQTEVE